MYSHLAPTVGGALVKRWAQYSDNNPEQPRPGVPQMTAGQSVLSLVNFILIVPVLLYMFYTLGTVYPTLAMVEDPLPDYDAIPIDDSNDDDDINKANGRNRPLNTMGTKTKPLTSSLRATHRLLSSIAGFRSQFRGIACAMFLGFLTFLITVPLLFIIGPFAHLVALLALTRFSTALTHIIITKPSDVSFFKRLPPHRRTLVATYVPILLFWLATQLSVLVPHLLAYLVAVSKREEWTPKDATKIAPIALLVVAMQLTLVFPAHVALVRVQASLLPHDDETIVPFDRTFGGRVEPEVVTGKGFATFRDALATVSKSSWIRIYVQQVKILGVIFAISFFYTLFVGLQFMLVR